MRVIARVEVVRRYGVSSYRLQSIYCVYILRYQTGGGISIPYMFVLLKVNWNYVHQDQ